MLQRSKVIIKPVLLLFISFFIFITGCKKGGTSDPDPGSISFGYSSLMVNGAFSGFDYKGINRTPIVKIAFSSSVDQTSFTGSVAINDKNMSPVTLIFSTEKNDSILVIKTANQLLPLSKYSLNVYTGLKSKAGGSLLSPITVNLTTAIDSTNKFATISNDALLELIQKQTFSYFWDFGHPVSGMARERNSSGDVVTTGGTGFGIMAIPVAIERNFISRTDGLLRIQKMVDFLTTKAVRFHGAYSHWINGSTGAVVPFSTQDNGADLVETSYLMMGLLTARQYFDGTAPNEAKLRDDINKLWNDVEWDWFRRDGGNVLYWHWSSNYGWAMNMPCLLYTSPSPRD